MMGRRRIWLSPLDGAAVSHSPLSSPIAIAALFGIRNAKKKNKTKNYCHVMTKIINSQNRLKIGTVYLFHKTVFGLGINNKYDTPIPLYGSHSYTRSHSMSFDWHIRERECVPCIGSVTQLKYHNNICTSHL
jgi:hypothetical protein